MMTWRLVKARLRIQTDAPRHKEHVACADALGVRPDCRRCILGLDDLLACDPRNDESSYTYGNWRRSIRGGAAYVSPEAETLILRAGPACGLPCSCRRLHTNDQLSSVHRPQAEPEAQSQSQVVSIIAPDAFAALLYEHVGASVHGGAKHCWSCGAVLRGNGVPGAQTSCTCCVGGNAHYRGGRQPCAHFSSTS